MNDAPSMSPEQGLLSLPRNGETLRFSWVRGSEDRFRMSLEGLGTKSESGQSLGRRISAFLTLMEHEGVAFADRSAPENRTDSSGEETTWMEVTPREHAFPAGGDGVIGFGGEDKAGARIRLPALGPVRAPDLSGYFLDLVAGADAVREICISFTRCELTPDRERVLDQNLRLPFPDVLALTGRNAQPDDLQCFMALWLVRRGGWRLRILVRVPASDEVPEVPLELMGREWFDSECWVGPARSSSGSEDDPLDFATRYPDGWAFPRLFPPAYAADRLEVEARMNPRLPLLPREGLLIGEVSGREVRMPANCRNQHTYILGATGTGKSTLLKRMIRHDLEGGEAVVLLDPHGDLFHEVLADLPEHRKEDLLVLDPGGKDPAPGFNILSDLGKGALRRQRVEFLLGELLHLFKDLWGGNPEAFGPMFELFFRNTVLLLAHQPRVQSLGDFDRVLVDESFRNELLSTCDQKDVCRFWRNTAEKITGEASLKNVAPYITCKMSPLAQSFYVGDMIRQKENALELDARLQRGGVVLANLDKGLLGHTGSRLLGTLLTTELFSVGLRRSRMDATDRAPVNVYIDEFQNFVSPTVGDMFAEARKFGLRLHVANQTLGQLSQSRDNLTHSVLGNVGNQIFFRVGVQDTGDLEPFFHPFTRGRMQELPNYRAFVRLMTCNGPLRPFIMQTLPVE